MKSLMKAGFLLALVVVMTTSCSVERKTRHGEKNVIDVGMNLKELQNSQAAVAPAYTSSIALAAR